jgi:hypothetical protein
MKTIVNVNALTVPGRALRGLAGKPSIIIRVFGAVASTKTPRRDNARPRRGQRTRTGQNKPRMNTATSNSKQSLQPYLVVIRDEALDTYCSEIMIAPSREAASAAAIAQANFNNDCPPDEDGGFSSVEVLTRDDLRSLLRQMDEAEAANYPPPSCVPCYRREPCDPNRSEDRVAFNVGEYLIANTAFALHEVIKREGTHLFNPNGTLNDEGLELAKETICDYVEHDVEFRDRLEDLQLGMLQFFVP